MFFCCGSKSQNHSYMPRKKTEGNTTQWWLGFAWPWCLEKVPNILCRMVLNNDDLKNSIKNWIWHYQRTPKLLLDLLDTRVFSGSVVRGSCWRFLGTMVESIKHHPYKNKPTEWSLRSCPDTIEQWWKTCYIPPFFESRFLKVYYDSSVCRVTLREISNRIHIMGH